MWKPGIISRASGSRSRCFTRFASRRHMRDDVLGDDRREDAADAVLHEAFAGEVQFLGGEVVLVEVDPGVAVHLEVESAGQGGVVHDRVPLYRVAAGRHNRFPMKKTALSFLAHPDDAEFLCAGTLIRLREAGWDVHIATATAGDGGTMTQDRWSISATRTAEGQAAAGADRGDVPLPRRARHLRRVRQADDPEDDRPVPHGRARRSCSRTRPRTT